MAQHADHPQSQRLARFPDGFFKVHRNSENLWVTDLPVWQEPDDDLAFDITMPPQADPARPTAVQKSCRMDVGRVGNG